MSVEFATIVILTLALLMVLLWRWSNVEIDVPSCDDKITNAEMNAFVRSLQRSATHKMVPIFNPFFNARRIILELLLLQHHLEEPGMLCKECIGRKHMPLVEGYALEAIGLVKSEDAQKPEYQELLQDMTTTVNVMRDLHKRFMNKEDDPAEISRAIRALRKQLSQKYVIMPD